jgi:hypothetical protein
MQARNDHSAETDRLHTASLLGTHPLAGGFLSRGGVHPEHGNRMAVTQTGSPSMAVIVKSGTVMLPGTEGGKQGVYVCHNDADVTLSIAAAPGPGLSRIDIVQAKVRDSQYSGGNNDWILEVKTGTAAGSPVAPNSDANGLTLAIVNVAASVSSINNGNIVWFAPYANALGGYIEALNDFYKPPSGTIRPGQRVHTLHNEVSSIWNTTDGQWDIIPTVRQGNYTPSTPSGFNLGASGTKAGFYKLIHAIRLCWFSVEFNFNGAGSTVPAGPTFVVDLPPGITPSQQGSGTGNYDWQNRGLVWRALPGGAQVLAVTSDKQVLTAGFAPSPSYMHVGGWIMY